MEFAIAIVAGLVGAILAYLAQIYFSLQSENTLTLSDHIIEISTIEAYALDYWATDNGKEIKNDEILASKLEGAMSASSCFHEEAKRILGFRYSDYVELDQEIYEATTGGSFRTSEKSIEYQRIIEIMTLCNRMRSLLRKSRREQYWAR